MIGSAIAGVHYNITTPLTINNAAQQDSCQNDVSSFKLKEWEKKSEEWKKYDLSTLSCHLTLAVGFGQHRSGQEAFFFNYTVINSRIGTKCKNLETNAKLNTYRHANVNNSTMEKQRRQVRWGPSGPVFIVRNRPFHLIQA